MPNKAKLNLYKKLGADLVQKGIWFLKKAFKIKPHKVSAKYIEKHLYVLGFDEDKNQIWTADRTYWYIDRDTMKEIIKYDWTDKKDYISDRYDCDNFADVFSAHMQEIFGLNTAGVARYIELLNEDGSHSGWHRANVLILKDKGIINAYVFEPQNDKLVKLTKEMNCKVDMWKTFKLNVVEFN